MTAAGLYIRHGNISRAGLTYLETQKSLQLMSFLSMADFFIFACYMGE